MGIKLIVELKGELLNSLLSSVLRRCHQPLFLCHKSLTIVVLVSLLNQTSRKSSGVTEPKQKASSHYQKYDLEYTMDLNTEMNNEGMVFTLNGKTFPITDNINVKKGDKVLVKLVNNSMMNDHPMYLHGHFFQVLSKNEKPVEGSPIIKDTINLKPGDEYVIAFETDNPGNWLFHCHDLHHPSVGMINLLKYEGFNPSFTPDDSAGNKPE